MNANNTNTAARKITISRTDKIVRVNGAPVAKLTRSSIGYTLMAITDRGEFTVDTYICDWYYNTAVRIARQWAADGCMVDDGHGGIRRIA